jgi:hypothetical protein
MFSNEAHIPVEVDFKSLEPQPADFKRMIRENSVQHEKNPILRLYLTKYLEN